MNPDRYTAQGPGAAPAGGARGAVVRAARGDAGAPGGRPRRRAFGRRAAPDARRRSDRTRLDRARGPHRAPPEGPGGGRRDPLLPRAREDPRPRPKEIAREFRDDYVALEHLLLALLRDGRSKAAEVLKKHGVSEAVAPGGAEGGPRQRPRRRPERRGEVPGAEALRARPDRAGPPRKARPGHRARRRDPPRDAGPDAPDEEQPGPHRRPGRRQDGRRRGARAAHRLGRRPREPEGQAGRLARPRRDAGRGEVPGRVRGAAQGRHQGGRGVGGEGHPLHRRAPHARRRRRRRGGDGRGEHAQARPRARRAARHRRHDARRVPQAHREGPRPRAPLPAGPRGRAVGRGHRSRSSAACRSATRSTTASRSPTRRSSRPPSSRTATSPTASSPTRRSTSSTRRPRA